MPMDDWMVRRMDYESLHRFDGYSVLVTGAARGIGRAVAERFGSEGAGVVLFDRAADALAQATDSMRSRGFKVASLFGDVARLADVEEAVSLAEREFGHLDVVVNNAGIDVHMELSAWTEEEFDRVIGVDLKGTFLMCQKAAARMAGRPNPSIINVASVMAFLTAPGYEAYTPAKAGVVALAKVLAIELGPVGIRVNTICPGYIDTTIWQESLSQMEDPDTYARKVAALHPVGRRGRPEDIAAVAAFLASADAQFISGCALAVDGGVTTQLPAVRLGS